MPRNNPKNIPLAPFIFSAQMKNSEAEPMMDENKNRKKNDAPDIAIDRTRFMPVD
ncbi:MAG: hypothetical protein GW780_05640 [Candidatus Aenigmarchaeota archaeon]|nr:hypothetical protein [Candidatus Aenigmarchaeota archaeon]NCO97480.1 hypothetical protein [Candidatus Aenigmarchaeota archaeon]NCS71610.1 hypothetical protein [Candidatus Aenigmarchaeota archaeon]